MMEEVGKLLKEGADWGFVATYHNRFFFGLCRLGNMTVRSGRKLISCYILRCECQSIKYWLLATRPLIEVEAVPLPRKQKSRRRMQFKRLVMLRIVVVSLIKSLGL